MNQVHDAPKVERQDGTRTPITHILDMRSVPIALCGYRCKEVAPIGETWEVDCVVCLEIERNGG